MKSYYEKPRLRYNEPEKRFDINKDMIKFEGSQDDRFIRCEPMHLNQGEIILSNLSKKSEDTALQDTIQSITRQTRRNHNDALVVKA